MKFTINTNLNNPELGIYPNLTFNIPLGSPFDGIYQTHDLMINWGDGITQSVQAPSGHLNVKHTYMDHGSYDIEIDGIIDGLSYNNSGMVYLISEISEWGNFRSTNGSLSGMNSVTGVGVDIGWMDDETFIPIDPSGKGPNNTFFYGAYSLESLPASLKLNKLEDGVRMFFRCGKLTNLPDGIELPELKYGHQMFYGVKIDTPRYSKLLIDMESNNNNNDVVFDGGLSTYDSSAQSARDSLVNRGWKITDGGRV